MDRTTDPILPGAPFGPTASILPEPSWARGPRWDFLLLRFCATEGGGNHGFESPKLLGWFGNCQHGITLNSPITLAQGPVIDLYIHTYTLPDYMEHVSLHRWIPHSGTT